MPKPILNLLEHMDVLSEAQNFEEVMSSIDPDECEYYDLEYNEENDETTITLRDAKEKVLGTIVMNDFDTAVSTLQEFFDLDDLDLYDYPDE